jgi:hypothetical protein
VPTAAYVFGFPFKVYSKTGGLCKVYHGDSVPVAWVFPNTVPPDDPNRLIYRVSEFFPPFTKPDEFVVDDSLKSQLIGFTGLDFHPVYLGIRITCRNPQAIIDRMDNSPVGSISMAFSKALIADQRKYRKYDMVPWKELEYVSDRHRMTCHTVFDIAELNWPHKYFFEGIDTPLLRYTKEFQKRIPAHVLDRHTAISWGSVWIVTAEVFERMQPYIMPDLFTVLETHLD